jgi:hypothetical protein
MFGKLLLLIPWRQLSGLQFATTEGSEKRDGIAIAPKADPTNFSALKILPGGLAPVCTINFGGWQGAGCGYSRA